MIVCEKRMRVCLRRFVNLWQSMYLCLQQTNGVKSRRTVEVNLSRAKIPGWGGGPNPDPFDTLKLFQMRDVTLFLILAPFCSSAVPTSLGWYYNKNGYGMIQYGYICVKIQETWTRRNRTYFDVHHPWFRVVASFDWDWYPTVSPSLSKMLCMGHSSIPQILDGSNMYLWLYRDVMYHWQCNISTYVM